MNATITVSEQSSETTMNAVILYDERERAKKAMALLKRASDRADEATQWRVRPWRLDLLSVPSVAAAALSEATDAHLIVLAVRDQADISSRLLNWLETWAEGRQVRDAALAVFDGNGGDALSGTASAALAQFAGRHGLCFIFGDVAADEDESTAYWNELHEREVAQTPTLLHILAQPVPGAYQHWGIND